LVLFAQLAASVEARFGERQGWRHPAPALATYLRFLATCGYGLSEVEQEIADSGREPKGTDRTPRSALATTPAQPGLLRVTTQFRRPTRHAEHTLQVAAEELAEL